MEEIKRLVINWDKTAKKIKLLRNDNINLRRYVCWYIKTKKTDENYCEGNNCENCTFEMDNSISQSEFAQVFNLSENVIANWETCRSNPTLEDLLLLCEICIIKLKDLLVFEP